MSHFSEDSSRGSIHYIPGKAGPACEGSAEAHVSISLTCTHVRTHAYIVVTAHKLSRQGQHQVGFDGNKKTSVPTLPNVSLKTERDFHTKQP